MRHGGFLLGRSLATLSLPRARFPGSGHRTGLSTAPRDSAPREEPQRPVESEGEQPLSYSGTHWRLHSACSSEHHRLVSPYSITLREQGSSAERDTRAGSPTAVAVLERERRDHQFARETTPRRRQRLIFDQRRVEEAERAEREAAAAMTRAERVADRSARARDSVAAATPPPRREYSTYTRGRNHREKTPSWTAASRS